MNIANWFNKHPRLNRAAIVPFEMLIAALAIMSGFVGLFHIGMNQDALIALLDVWVVQTFNVAYLLSGAAMVAGIMSPDRRIEGAGLIIVATSVIVRTFALILLLGFDSSIAVSILFNAFVVVACVTRLSFLNNYTWIVMPEIRKK